MLKHLQGVQQVQVILCLPTGMVKKEADEFQQQMYKCNAQTQHTKSLNAVQSTERTADQNRQPRKVATYTVEERCVCVFVFACRTEMPTVKCSDTHLHTC